MRLAALALLLLFASFAGAQSVHVRLAGSEAAEAAAQVGDTLLVEVGLDLGDLRAAGVALHLQLPARLSPVVDGAAGPFRPGLFASGVEFANQVVPAAEAYGLPAGASLMTYAVVLGPAAVRFRSGAGTVATFAAVCTDAFVGDIKLYSNPVYGSMVVLDDGRSELPLLESRGLQLSVTAAAGRRTQGSWAALKTDHLP